MEPWLMTLIIFGAMFALLILGLPVSFTLGGLSLLIGYFVWGGTAGFYAVTLSSLDKMSEFTITAIPLFILMAAVLQYSDLADELYEVIHRWFGGIKGGLAVGTIIISTIFAAMVGISALATATLGLIALPAMIKRGYNKYLTAGCITSGGALGVLIPPSILFILMVSRRRSPLESYFLAVLCPGFYWLWCSLHMF